MNADLAYDVERWLEKARDDLGVAQHLDKQYHPKPVEIICFHCQQAAEKAIKAVILSRGAQSIPKSHELVFLLEKLDITVESRILDFADSLSQYAVNVRYPNEMYLQESHCRTALCAAQEILKWSEAQINLEKSGAQ